MNEAERVLALLNALEENLVIQRSVIEDIRGCVDKLNKILGTGNDRG